MSWLTIQTVHLLENKEYNNKPLCCHILYFFLELKINRAGAPVLETEIHQIDAIQDEESDGDLEDEESNKTSDGENENMKNLSELYEADEDAVRLLKAAVRIVMKSPCDIQALLDMVDHVDSNICLILFSWYCIVTYKLLPIKTLLRSSTCLNDLQIKQT